MFKKINWLFRKLRKENFPNWQRKQAAATQVFLIGTVRSIDKNYIGYTLLSVQYLKGREPNKLCIKIWGMILQLKSFLSNQTR